MSVDSLLLEWTRALGWTLIHTLWQGALVAAAYGTFRLLARRADVRLRYAGGMATLAILLLLPAVTLWQLAPGSADLALAVGALAPASGWAGRIDAWLPLVVVAWLSGVLLAGTRETLRWYAVRRLLLGSASPLLEWTARAARVAQRLRVSRPVRVVSSAVAQTPSLIGWLAPVIVLPASALLALSPRQLEMVIAHELAHVRRADYLVNLLQVMVETLLFHHPAVHWISRDVRELREACCDDLVLRSGVDPLHYADTLASLAELRGITHAPAMAATGGSLLLRVRRIVGVSAHAPARLDGQLVVLFAGLLAVALMLAGQGRPGEGPAPPMALDTLARGAVAAVGAVAQPASHAPVPLVPAVQREPAPVRRDPVPSQSPAPLAVAAPSVASAAFVAAVAPVAPPAPAVLPLDIAGSTDLSGAVAVEELRLKRVQMRPLMVIANDPPIDCVRSLGSRLCRALPPNDPTAHAEASRGVLDAGRAAMLDGPLKARALRGPGD